MMSINFATFSASVLKVINEIFSIIFDPCVCDRFKAVGYLKIYI